MGKAMYCDRCGVFAKIPPMDLAGDPQDFPGWLGIIEHRDYLIRVNPDPTLLCPACAGQYQEFMKAVHAQVS